MSVAEALHDCAHLLSPAALARADQGEKFKLPPHIKYMDRELLEVGYGKNDRLMVNVPFQHSKSTMCSHYFPAWMLLLNPHMRIVLAAHEERFAMQFGAKVKDTIERWGKPLGVRLKADSQAKDEWVVDKHGGGMVCRGMHGSLQGRPADLCLTGDTLVFTRVGARRIDTLDPAQYPVEVLSFNHDAGVCEWKKVLARKDRDADELVEVVTVSGRTVRATADHRFFVVDKGYTGAADLRVGDVLLSVEEESLLPALCSTQGRLRGAVQEVLRRDEAPGGGPDLHRVREGVQEARGGRTQGREEWQEGDLLLAGMLHGEDAAGNGGEVQGVRQSYGEGHEPLLRCLPAEQVQADPPEREALPRVRCRVPAQVVAYDLLHRAVRRRRPFGEDDRQGQLPLQERQELCRPLPEHAATDARAGRPQVRGVRPGEPVEGDQAVQQAARTFSGQVEPDHASCQRERLRQPAREPRDDVRLLPLHAPQVKRDAVSLVRRVRGGVQRVHDVQVEGNNNLFAGEILVHNCIIDDPIKDAEQALSAVTLQNHWDWYQTVAFSRLGPTAPVVIVTTRWCKGDLCGRLIEESRSTGEKWRQIKFKAIAGHDDILGRSPGEALWPERVPLARLEMIRKKRGRWFAACWQQEPEDAEGTWFKPKYPTGDWRWPLYTDVGDAYSIPQEGGRRKLVGKWEVTILAVVDWAYSVKSTADHTAIGTFALTPGGELLLLEMINRRFRPEQLAGALADVCTRMHPNLVAVEVGHPTLANEYRRFPEIPEIRWLKVEGMTKTAKNKLARALHAIMMCENGRFYLPDDQVDEPWLAEYASQMAGFTGMDDDEDDMVDVTGNACKLAQELRVVRRQSEAMPEVLDFGKDVYGAREVRWW